MSLLETIILALGLAMDACAVSICKGLAMKKMNLRNAIIIAFYFGLFQAIMPLIGYFLGDKFYNIIAGFDYWIATIMIGAIGFNMIKESRNNENETMEDDVKFKTMIVLSIATSIDALATGITLAALKNRNPFLFSANRNYNIWTFTNRCKNWK